MLIFMVASARVAPFALPPSRFTTADKPRYGGQANWLVVGSSPDGFHRTTVDVRL
jgi:hypothetical protein